MIRRAVVADREQILALYRLVASIPGGLARSATEVSDSYVDGFMQRAAADGLEFVDERDGRIIAEIHTARPGIACFSHVLSDLTVAVSPACQGQGVGRALFQAVLREVMSTLPDITRVELYVRSSNARARSLYDSLGFDEEGRLRERVRGPDGMLEDDIAMGWLRPGA